MGQNPEQKTRPSHRGLRAVFVADMIDSRGAGSASENVATKTLNEVRSIVCQQLQIHGGSRFEIPGEAVFALFESAVNAVRCALETQGLLALQTDDTHLRIGIHLGDVLFEDSLPRGEALLIAAGLEALADPGGILVSGAVMDAVSARISATFEERGVPRLKDVPRRIATFAVTPPPERTSADKTRVGMSALDRTTQFDLDTLRSLREQQAAEKVGDHTGLTSDKPILLDQRHIAEAGAMTGIFTPSRETEPETKAPPLPQPRPDKSARTPVVAPVAAQRPEDAEKRVSQEPPTRRAGQAAEQSGRPASAPAAKSDVLTEPAGQGLSAECVEALSAALAVHLGPFAKVLISRHVKDASSTEQLVSLLEREIQSNEERFQFRLRASHICKTYSNRRSDEA